MKNGIKAIFDLLSVKPLERFKILEANQALWFFISEELKVYQVDPNGNHFTSESLSVLDFFDGRYTLIKKPYQPIMSEEYYYYDPVDKLTKKRKWINELADWNFYKLKNCFKHKGEITHAIKTQINEFYEGMKKQYE